MASKKSWSIWGGIIIALLLAIPLYKIVSPFLIPIFFGGVLAMICRPIYLWCCIRLHNHERLSAALATLAIVLCVVIPIFTVLWFSAKNAIDFLQTTHLADTVRSWFTPGETPAIVTQILDWLEDVTPFERTKLIENAIELSKNVGMSISAAIANFIASLPKLIVGIFITIISLYFLFLDWKEAASFISAVTPLTKTQQASLYETFEEMCRAVVLGTLAAAVVQGILVGLAFFIFGVPQALIFTLVSILMAMIPFIGATPVWVGGVIFLLVNHSYGMAIGLFIVGLLIGITDNIVKPIVVSGHSQLHPLLVLISVLGGLGTFGLTGLFLGPVLMAVFVSALRLLAQKMPKTV